MVETAPGAGMKVILRVPKSFPGVRPALPDYSHPDDIDDFAPMPGSPAANGHAPSP
jgi:two-component system LytT family sensor kinase